MADACEEEVAAYPPDQEPRKRGSLRVTLDIAIGFGTRKLTKLGSLWMAGNVDQGHQRQRDAQRDPCSTPSVNSPAITMTAMANDQRLRANSCNK